MMARSDIQNSQQTIQQWLQQHSTVFAHQQNGNHLELAHIPSGQILKLSWTKIQTTRLTQQSPGRSYINVVLDDGRQLVLADQGFVWPPDFTNTGPIELPASVYCYGDLQYMLRLFERGLGENPPPHKQDMLELMMAIIAILDGAKVLDLHFERETRIADQLLARLEKGSSTSS